MKNNPSSGKKHTESQEKSTKCHVYVEPGVQIDLVEDLRQKYETAQSDNTSHSRKILFWTIASAILLFIYADLTAWQSCTNWRLLTLTRKTSEREDRAWVAVQPKGPFQIIPGGQLGFPFTVINTGRTPARHIHAEMWAKFIPVTYQGEMIEKGPRLEMEAGDLFPNNVNVIEIFKGEEIIRQRTITPGGHETEAWPIETAEVRDFDQNKTYAIGYLVVSYDDIFGVRHWTRFCAFLQPPSRKADTGKCVAYNGEDDNDEP
jgi:hypothetical protein